MGKPEKIVERDVIAWCIPNRFYVHVIESKAIPRVGGGFRRAGNAPKGFTDICGNTLLEGHALPIYIELKAPGKRSDLSQLQYIFLLNKIEQGCFATVTDSVEYLVETWDGYKALKTQGDRRRFLVSRLPQKSRFRRV